MTKALKNIIHIKNALFYVSTDCYKLVPYPAVLHRAPQNRSGRKGVVFLYLIE